MKKILTLSFLFCASVLVAQTKHAQLPLFPTYKGLIMAGYQGWFDTPRNGMMYPDENHIRIDMWPDVSEYEDTYPTGLKLADGSTARFFTSQDKSTVDLHFKWMKEYGLDGVFVQRFFDAARPDGERNIVLKNAIEASVKNERALAVMYDLSGMRSKNQDCSRLIEDWKYLVDSLSVTNPKGKNTYLHHNGKPLVAIWGIGFPDRPYNIRNIGIERFIDFLKNDPEYGGCAVMLGVPTFWRDLQYDCVPDPYLHEIIRSADIVLPWMVQRFTPLLHNDMDRLRDVILSDIKWCKEAGIDYVPCVTPGFTWHNLSRFEFPDDVKPVGSIPRQGGRFYWQQLTTAITAGATMIYVAMFDEVNEGTAIFKVSNNPPVSNVAKFADNDGQPSDHYLWLTGEASKMLKRRQPLEYKMPQRDMFKVLEAENIAYTVTNFAGYDCAEFKMNKRECKVVKPKETCAGRPWIWRARFWAHEPQVDIALLEKGYHLVYCDQSGLVGNSVCIANQNAFYALLRKGGLAQKAILEGMSRGALYALNWAAENPDKVAAVYVDNPLLDCRYFANRDMNEVSRDLLKAYKLPNLNAIRKFSNSPTDKVSEIVSGGYPILILCADQDEAVPLYTVQEFEKKVRDAGGNITVIVKKGFKHHPHSFPDPQPILDVILAQD